MAFITIRIKRGTTANWNASTKILALGELGVDTTLNKLKLGNGSSLWTALPYLNIGQDDLDDAIASLSNTTGETYVPLNKLAAVNGVATLDANAQIPVSQLGNIIASAPGALDTLNELAEALGDDSNYAATITSALATKLASTTAAETYVAKTDPSVDYYITNSGSGAYLVNGVSNGTINFEKGKKYRIHVNALGHPFWIQTSSGAYNMGNVYSTGVVGAGTDSGHILIELPQNAPDTLYYACEYHSSMAGSIQIGSPETLRYINYSGTSLVLNNSQLFKIIHTTSNSSISVVCPNDVSNTIFPIGSYLEIRQMGDGQISVTSESPSTLVAADDAFKSRTKYSSIIIEKHASNPYYVTGDATS